MADGRWQTGQTVKCFHVFPPELRCSSAQDLEVVVPHRRGGSFSSRDGTLFCMVKTPQNVTWRVSKLVPTGCVQRRNNADAA